mgnify:CR=1 FL=1
MNYRKQLMKKLYRSGTKVLGAVACALVALLALGAAVFTSRKPELVDYDYYYEDTGKYAYLYITELEDWTATYDGDTYYTAWYGNSAYNVVLSDRDFKSLSSQGKKDGDYTWTFSSPVRLEGKIKSVSEDVAELFVETYDNSFTLEQYYDYFGYTYLDTTDMVSGISFLLMILGGLGLLGALLLGLLSVNEYQSSGKSVDALSPMEQEEALSQLQYNESGSDVVLGESYLFSRKTPFVAAYKDILWIYPKNVRTNGVGTAHYLVVNTTRLKNLQINSNDQDLYQRIVGKVQAVNPDVLVGYSAENQVAYDHNV